MNQETENKTVQDLNNASNATRGTENMIEFEIGCINLISQLETQVASARGDGGRNGHVENASENTDKLLELLLNFCDEFLTGERFDNAFEEIKKAKYASMAHKEVLDTRSWGFALMNLFGAHACSDASVRQSYDNLGDALLGACSATLLQAIEAAGSDSEIGKTVEQSLVVFVEEFQASWRTY